MEDKIFFLPGDTVTIKQDIPNKPIMFVVKKVTSTFKIKNEEGPKEEFLRGIRCRWFTLDGALQEAIFNTKDLYKIKGND